ncbi:hypothetical protein EJF18_30857 [Clavispora lusitaniae]|uniref:Uncharacterized protein n=3 Tax=Clavispora lusitaniae TaxID=36911 RepID=C4Y453_CLAL4|nr:uncharacterized protein CLUG_02425 [Clavispora lusitaniae ATCC 42720]KAF7580300.1 hypothetical protein FOB63_005370 [Clavispora lusitaniae]EEQ38299.1 predicted protein [Clavispora lusitaniae ATCC 42720]OVF05151.1 hypothetical protein A9F13_24g00506 [Clavispora lusitaniae]QFZ27866.1 hypothetical protein EJF14_30857 [Clavispora lusitaniae]QFZ32827.1 hypothetical protein EJF16_30857 [Clavispora lusitaniae]
MNRKRKNFTLSAELGDPLPLPYRPTSAIKNEDDDSQAIESNDTSFIEPTRRRKLPQLGYRDRLVEEKRVLSPRSLPIWHQRTPSIETNTRYIHLDSIQRKIEQIREEFSDESGTELEKQLEKIDQQLEDILEQRHENSLVEELKRLQQLNVPSPSSRTSTPKVGRLFLIALVLVLLAGVSFCAGQMSYEYCYYFC